MAYDYFCCYHDYRGKVAKLSDQEVGRLFRALMKYSETGETQELTGRESVAFDFIAVDIDRAKEKYEEKCKKIRKTQSPVQATVSDRQRLLPNASDRQRPTLKKKKKKKKNI